MNAPPPVSRLASPSPDAPTLGSLIGGPLLVSWLIVGARLWGELHGWPKWIASTAPGGPGALLGIAWLPPLLGAWWASRIAGTTPRPKKRLAFALLAYGYLARLEVFAITWIAEKNGWDTHFTKYGPKPEEYPATFQGRMIVTAVAQLGLWPLVWTLGTGMLTGWLVLRARAKRAAAS